MRRLAIFVVLMCAMRAMDLWAQTMASPPPQPAPPAKKAEKASGEKAANDKSAVNKLFGADTKGSNEPTTTEIFADEAFFDSGKSMGVFSGHVKVTDPRFNLQADKLTVFISKGENQGLERAVAEGNVGVVRDRPDPSGGASTRAVGRSDKAVYLAATGNVELTGTPRVQQGLNTHIATSPDTVMIINQSGQLTTHGPSRTDIRQQPKDENAEKKDDDKKDGEKKDGDKKDKKEKAESKSKP